MEKVPAFKPVYQFVWRADQLAILMKRHKIPDRGALADAIGIARATAYKTFEGDWSGTATATVLAQLAGALSVKPDRLVTVVEV